MEERESERVGNRRVWDEAVAIIAMKSMVFATSESVGFYNDRVYHSLSLFLLLSSYLVL